MGNDESRFAYRVAQKAPIKLNPYQTQGNKILQMAEAIRPFIAKWLEGAKTADGLPVQPATVRAVALNTAQILAKQHV